MCTGNIYLEKIKRGALGSSSTNLSYLESPNQKGRGLEQVTGGYNVARTSYSALRTELVHELCVEICLSVELYVCGGYPH